MRINSTQLKLEVKKRLLALPNAKLAGSTKSEVQLFCPFCKMDTTHGHFYVSVDINDPGPMMFHCFKCEMSGYLNSETLHMLNIHDLKLGGNLRAFNNNLPKTNTNKSNLLTNNISFKIPDYNEERDLNKKIYLESRMGTKFSEEELKRLKVIFSFGEFIRTNNITKLTCDNNRANMLHNDFIGFLTTKNEFINFRDASNKYDKKHRYYKYNIFNSLDNTKKFYTIPNEIDLLSTDDINIVMAEGIFDITSIYANVFNRETKNIVYAAMCSSGYTNVIKYFLQLGLVGSNIHLHIFSDKDRNLDFYRKNVLNEGIKEWISDVTIYYNATQGEKDFGVPKDKIRITSSKL